MVDSGDREDNGQTLSESAGITKNERQNRNSVLPDIKNPRQILNLTGIEDKADFISGIPVLSIPEEIFLKRTRCFFWNSEYQ